MNWKMISVAALAGTSLAFGLIETAAKLHLKKLAKEKALVCRPEEEVEAFEQAKKQIEIYEDLKKRESSSMRSQVEGWKRSTRYEERKRDIYEGMEEAVRKFKASIGYDIKRRELIDAAENELEAFKDSIDFDAQISELEDAIREAQSKFDGQKNLFDAAGSELSETATELKLAAEKAKNKVVSESQEKIKALKEQVEAQRKQIERTKQAGLQKLETQVLNEKSRLQSYSQKELSKLDRQFEEAKDNIAHGIESGRTPEEMDAIALNDANKQVIQEQLTRDAERAELYQDAMQHHESIAEWLKAKECPKWCVIFVSSLPLIPLGYLTARYIKFVVMVVKAM